jgi:Domain of unknown function (DUF4389)
MDPYPVRVSAHHDTPPNRWLWLVKWLLLIPHYVLLAGLWAAFIAATVIAYVVVLATGRYPKAMFEFGVGVLRWTWRVMYYGYVVLGTDRYPPFTLNQVPDYPAELDIDPALDRPRWLPLVAWLLVIPHGMILKGLLNTELLRPIPIGSFSIPIPVGVTSAGITVIATQLAITGRHPRGLYDLFTGVARWLLRVVAYVALLSSVYPPFRLDQGDTEPAEGLEHTGVGSKATTAVTPPTPSGRVSASTI